MTRAGVRDEGRGAPAAACKRSFAGPRAPAKAAMTGPERHREPRTERRERPHAGSAFGNGVMRSAQWTSSRLDMRGVSEVLFFRYQHLQAIVLEQRSPTRQLFRTSPRSQILP